MHERLEKERLERVLIKPVMHFKRSFGSVQYNRSVYNLVKSHGRQIAEVRTCRLLGDDFLQFFWLDRFLSVVTKKLISPQSTHIQTKKQYSLT